MVYFATSQEWFEQSSLLLQARPTTTRITTKYNVLPPTTATSSSRRKRKANLNNTTESVETNTIANITTAPAGPKATLTLKTYDPVSGACLKYRTNKAAEVGRLVASLGRLGRRMAALPAEDETSAGAGAEDAIMTDAVVEGAAEASKEAAATIAAAVQQTKQVTEGKPEGAAGAGGGGGGGGAKKKKKGKK